MSIEVSEFKTQALEVMHQYQTNGDLIDWINNAINIQVVLGLFDGVDLEVLKSMIDLAGVDPVYKAALLGLIDKELNGDL